MQDLPLLLPVIGWVAGLGAARCDGVNMAVMLGVGAAALCILLFQRGRRPVSRLFIVSVFLLAGLAWGWTNLLADARRINVDDTWLHGVPEFTARVEGIQQQAGAWRLTLSAVQRSDGSRLAGDIWLYVHHRALSDADTTGDRSGLLPGDRIQARAALHVPRNHRNPAGFDFAAWCFDRHIALLGSSRGAVDRIASGASHLERLRQHIRHELAAFPPDRSGVIRALLLGEREGIPDYVSAAFSVTGAAHLLAISGLHVGMVAVLGFALCWFVLTRREAWIVGLPVRGIALIAGVSLALAYATLAGWPLPTQRATMMLGAAALAWWMRAHAAPLNTLLGALGLILLFDASALGSLSLWLSFVATTGILVWSGRPLDEEIPVLFRWLIGLFAVTLVASLFTLPLVADNFGRLPVYGLPANLLMTPLYTLFILPLSLLAAILTGTGLDAAAHAVFAFAGDGVEWGNRILLQISNWPAGHLWLPSIPLWLSGAYAAGMGLAVLLFYRDRPGMGIGLLLLTLVFYAALAVPENPPVQGRFIAWDVGQGAASSLILSGGRVMVIDAAGRPGSRYNAGTTVAEGLRSLGVTHIDVLVISHDQSDHLGGVLSLLHRVNRVGELWLADVPEVRHSVRVASLRRAVLQQGGRIRWLQKGDKVDASGFAGTVLWPPLDYAPGNRNNTSLVLRLDLQGGHHLLLGGDIESPAEKKMVGWWKGGDLASDVMLMPHHGSATSSSSTLLAAVHPALAVAQTGYANRYGFPAPAVVRRYTSLGANLRNTADGAVVVDFASSGRLRVLGVPPVTSARRNRALQWWRHFL